MILWPHVPSGDLDVEGLGETRRGRLERRTEEEEPRAVLLPGAHELRRQVNERHKVGVLSRVAAPGVWGRRREGRRPRGPRADEPPALSGGGGPEAAGRLGEEAPRGTHGGGGLFGEKRT